MATEYNPIVSVDGKQVACPSKFVWKLQDISDSDAGRTEDGVMHKKRIGQAVKIELAWQNIKTEDASVILNAFNPEYISVAYLDPKENGNVTKTFYVGDRSAPVYNTVLGVWSEVAFNIIERGGVD